eukprot:1145033-Pelagomonas_calceolata.AAC.9
MHLPLQRGAGTRWTAAGPVSHALPGPAGRCLGCGWRPAGCHLRHHNNRRARAVSYALPGLQEDAWGAGGDQQFVTCSTGVQDRRAEAVRLKPSSRT